MPGAETRQQIMENQMNSPKDPQVSPIKIAVTLIVGLALAAAIVMLVAKKNPITQAAVQVNDVICSEINASTNPGTRAACAELAKEKAIKAAKSAGGE